MRAGKAKSEQIKKTGAKIVTAACENCKLQLADLNNYYNLGVEVKGVVDLVAEAILNRKKISYIS
jgi:Fe-S oxidoreductase